MFTASQASRRERPVVRSLSIEYIDNELIAGLDAAISQRPGGRIGQYLPLELLGHFPKLAAHEWRLCSEWRGPLYPQHQPLKRLLSGYH